jgi:hypothetical protein
MKITQKTIRNSAAFALLLIAATRVSAQSWMQFPYPKIALSLTAAVQGGDDGGYPVDKVSATTTHWTSQTLLTIVENKLGVSFPTGAALTQWGTNIVVMDASALYVITNLTAAGLAHLTFSDFVINHGQSDFNTSSQSMSQNFIFKLSFNDGNGNSFNLTGLGREKYSSGPIDQFGTQKFTVTVSSTLVGEGSVGYTNAVFSGSALSSRSVTVAVQ